MIQINLLIYAMLPKYPTNFAIRYDSNRVSHLPSHKCSCCRFVLFCFRLFNKKLLLDSTLIVDDCFLNFDGFLSRIQNGAFLYVAHYLYALKISEVRVVF